MPPKTLSQASGLALFMLAAAKPDTPVGSTIVAREIARPAFKHGHVHPARGEFGGAGERARLVAFEANRSPL